MDFICGQCARRLQSLAPAARTAFRRTSAPYIARRHRSTAVPSFTESVSTELNEVLSTIRSDYFVPAYLSNSQRKLVFQSKFQPQIEGGDSTVTLGDEEFVLQPLDSKTLDSQRKDVLQRTYALLAETNEWHHLLPLFEGMSRVGNTSTDKAMGAVIVEAARRRQLGTVLQCLEANKRTGLSLKDPWVVRAVLRGVRLTAEESGWDVEEVQRAIRLTDRISRLLLSKSHNVTVHESKRRGFVALQLHTDPLVTALWLELRAVDAYKAGRDTDGSVAMFYERLRSLYAAINLRMEAAAGRATTEPESDAEAGRRRGIDSVRSDAIQWGSPNFYDVFWPRLSLWHGVLLAEKVLGKSDPMLNAIANKYGNSAAEATLVEEANKEDAEKRQKELALARDNLGYPIV